MRRRSAARGKPADAVFEAERDAPLVASLAHSVGTALDLDRQHALVGYAALVAMWTRRVDLVATRGARELVELLFLDAFVLAASNWIPEGARLVDVGAGGGAPSVPLALLRPDVSALLVEPRQKRGAFLRTATASLGLVGRVRVHEGRVEPEAPSTDLGDFDLSLSRATFAPELWVPTGLALAPATVALLGAAEWPAALRAPADTRDYVVPSNGARRRALLFQSE